ncbi:Alpha-ketoglutarate-dependent dioxygenase AlkB [Melia azedarach]|nr:Alpha-ketoglutarate-dependent dioxygenase AlkB [Melia azedarach]
MSRGRGKSFHHVSPGSGWKHCIDKTPSNCVYRAKSPAPDVSANSLEAGGSNMKQPESLDALDSVHGNDDLHSLSTPDSKESHLDVNRIQIGETPKKEADDAASFKLKTDFSGKVKVADIQEESSLPSKANAEDQAVSLEKGAKNLEGIGGFRFDICPPKTGTPVMLKPSLLVKNRQKRNEMKLSMEAQIGSELRSGMVLLKSYLSLSDQVKIVKACQGYGLGPGGFYQPSYHGGGRLHLKMMCLGKNWDPETSKYEDIRSADGAKPPNIPTEFYQFVSKAIQDSQVIIKGNSKVRNVEAELPWMSPNICLVNFYSTTGKLGLHQDKDESRESLAKGLPVVSFSIGDSAEFLYGDHRDEDQAQKVKLESGDVLIFGGKSRHIFHGVSTIFRDTTPKTLQEETNILPGRLNLTFRQY